MERNGWLRRLSVVTMAEPRLDPVEVSAVSVPTTADFASFCAAHGDRLARALALALGNRELGRDAAAEGLARAWERWSKVSTYANPAGWVYRVGLNWGRSRLRRIRREITTDVFPDRGSIDVHVDTAVVEAMRDLSPDHRAVVVGRLYLDWSEADVAAALDLPAGTVKSRLSRALAQLDARLRAEPGD